MRRKRSAGDFAEEIKAHLELEAAELKSEGLGEDEARRKARVGFGNVGAAQERFHLRGRIAWIESVVRDLRYGMRGAWRNPGFAAVAMLTMALAIGAMTAIFSLLDQALLRALPVREPGQVDRVELCRRSSWTPSFGRRQQPRAYARVFISNVPGPAREEHNSQRSDCSCTRQRGCDVERSRGDCIGGDGERELF